MKYLIIIIFSLLIITPVQANSLSDMDKDGVPDRDEIEIYKTNPENSDTDGDGYSDFIELNNGYSPLESSSLKLTDSDYDNDGLSDKMELNFGTDLSNSDTDGDGYLDGVEIENGFDPNSAKEIKLEKRIEVDTSSQVMKYFLGGVKMGDFIVSTGAWNTQTPKGHFKIDYKDPRALAAKYNLWMPWWMSLQHGYFGIHELPEWSNGVKEGEDHLGKPVSHGCIRLGVGPAKYIYDWAPMGTEVFIY
ncbi:L,D-transpeptidase family protein [Patescibacteria group bacterium]|nr:L,D-transpeptidase family protein [Patescibacteria group bacterium]